MIPNLEKHQNDLKLLVATGELLHFAMQYEALPDEFEEAIKDEKTKLSVDDLPNFSEEYQTWYSEAGAVIRQLLPDRIDDFTRYYLKPKSRKEIDYESYRIEDYLQGLTVTQGDGVRTPRKTIVGPDAAIPQFRQQLAILKSVRARLKSSLFDIKQLVQADLFDSELEAASELVKKGFLRGAGAVAGVVLERHLKETCANHNHTSRRKKPSISDYNDLLKTNNVLAVPDWRRVQRLGDIRNLCDHSSDREPTKEEVEELVSGAGWATHTIF